MTRNPVGAPDDVRPVSMTRSLHNRNYRRYVAAHGLSNVGLWLQQTAELWLILQLTGSGTAVGLHSVLRFGPILLFGASAGVLSDRFPRRRLLLYTQAAYMVAASIMAVVAWSNSPSLPLIYGLVLVQGLIVAVDNPLRRAFVRDLVTDDELANAVSLHASVGTVSRTVGPAIAGLLIAGVGEQWCFTVNAVSYLAVLGVLLTLDGSALRRQPLVERAPRQVRAAMSYALERPPIRDAFVLCLVVGVFAWNWAVLVPFYATEEFAGDAVLYGTLLSLLSLGALGGALITARLRRVRRRHLVVSAWALSAGLLTTAVAPTLVAGAAGLILVGLASSATMVAVQARIQLRVDDAMSGRVLALYAVVFVGSKPFSGALGGWVTEMTNSRVAFGLGGVAVGLAACHQWLALRSRDQGRRAAG